MRAGAHPLTSRGGSWGQLLCGSDLQERLEGQGQARRGLLRQREPPVPGRRRAGRGGCRLFRVGAERAERRVQGEAGGAAGPVSRGSVSGEEGMGRRVSGWPVRKRVRQC